VIGGKVLDASALAALARRRPAALAWFETARLVTLALYVPTLALAEVRAVRPDAGPLLAEVLGHPSAVLVSRSRGGDHLPDRGVKLGDVGIQRVDPGGASCSAATDDDR
jgi:hypothetical protein